jgi:Raf kinase inhibitor-like YbhB/YbcL family protein
MQLTLISSAFADGARIPHRYTCDGEDLSPPFRWLGAPTNTKSFVFICSDPDAPGGTWYHWGLYDVPVEIGDLREGYPKDARVGPVRQAVTDFKRIGYGGPCPPRDHGEHHYRFRLMALDVVSLGLRDTPGCREVEQAAEKHLMEETVLVGTYSR